MVMWPQGRPFTVPIHTGPVGPHYYLQDTIDSSHSLLPVNITNSTNGAFPYQEPAASTLSVLARRKRASKPKVRTGCKTCKIRRVKCDETKPSCKRCTSTGRKCDGYEFPKETSEKSSSPSTSSPPSRSYGVIQHLFQPDSISKPFQGNTQERRIFHRFQYCTVPAFAGGSEAGFWTNLVLKVGLEEPIVRNAIIALGTLHEDYQDRSGRYSPQLIEDNSYRHALSLYGGALRQLNQRLNEPSKLNAKLAIVASILFACFEVLRRNNMAAVIHYQQGMRELFRQMNLPKSDDASLVTSDSQATFREIPENEVDELLRVFARYDIQACTFSKDRAERLSTHITLPRVLPTDMTLSQVRYHLDNLLVSVYQLVKSDLRMYRYWDADSVPTEWRTQTQEAVKTFDTWMTALEDFFTSNSPRLTNSEIKSLLGMRLQIKTAVIMLKVCIDCGPESIFDTFRDDFEDMVSKVEQMTEALGMPEAEPLEMELTPFTMELGIIHPLFFVACKCRDWDLRRRAIVQLKRAGKEGVWEGPIMAVLASRIMELEEEGLLAGEAVPETQRFHEIKKNVDYDNRQVLMEATKAIDTTWKNFAIHREAVAF
ncbi:hypothetical protein, variant [Exophiala oligosperma]|uniref:Zn(2)-C6 fungal-type domain-containing protein n=1 Tax=Exophiala oligosperma TaxID=215243 RepID=A0A0D2BK42_9EURO|nr:uncharacterized protein PV06_09766 [Exophiala oligosperma]XP_016257993.1 hypothetical protein, variant [Exophiala oligosperma]KIW37776.1 hypothetical protein PV06_09766 [Exophiala oligosperma]KIW37777.1 hypothetical protein, variant [Exophiala oligosperma]